MTKNWTSYEDYHCAEDVWFGPRAPAGDWITECGDFHVTRIEGVTDTIERNHCCCPFCEELRAIYRDRLNRLDVSDEEYQRLRAREFQQSERSKQT
jgi:hypothetical protein